MRATLQTETQTDQFADESTTPPSVRVIEAVDDATDADLLSMEPLYETIDPDALDAMVESGIDGHVRFEFNGHDVTVYGDGTVVVDGRTTGGD